MKDIKLVHYVIALQMCMLGILFANAWFAGAGSVSLVWWMARVRWQP